MWGKGANFFTQKAWISVRFDDVRGLKQGDPVVIRGIQQGEVDQIELHSEYAKIRLWVHKNIPLFSDLKIFLENRELMGGKQISIFPGRSKNSIFPDQIFTGETKSDIFDVLVKAEQIMAHADSIFKQVSAFLDQERFSRVADNIEQTTIQAKAILTENRTSLRSVIDHLDETTRRIKEDSTFYRMGRAAVHLDSTILLFHRFAGMIQSKEGSLGQLIQDKRLYDRLFQTTIDLDSLIRDIRANPKKYIHVSVF
jgi:phospholipid/cholesterol/gamma-HCH transport system substrate-binding protein